MKACGFEADDLGDQLQPEAVHDRHGEDQRPDAERDADHRDDRDEGKAAMLALGAEIARREHALERAERPFDHACSYGLAPAMSFHLGSLRGESSA